jgi:hypothetical protein
MAEKLIGATFADLDSLISNAKDRAIRRTIAMVQKEKKSINNTNKGFYNIKSKQEKMIGGIICDAQNSSQNNPQISKVCKRDLDYIMKMRSEQQSSVNRALLPMLKSMIEYKYQSNTIDDGSNQQVQNINKKNATKQCEKNSNHFYQNNFVPHNGSTELIDPLLYPFRDFQSDELDNEEFDNDEFDEMDVAESDKNYNTQDENQHKNKKQFSLLSRLFFSTSHDLYTFSTTYYPSNELQSTGGNIYIDCSDQYNDETELILLFQNSLLYSPFHLHNQAKVLMQRFILELKKNKILADGKNTTSNDNSMMNDDVDSDKNNNDNDDVFMQEEIKLYQNEIMEKVNYIQKKAIPILLQQEFFASIIEYKQALAIPNVEYINIPHLLQVLYKWNILKHTNDEENITSTDDKTNVLGNNDESISTAPPPTVDQEETDHPVQPKAEFDLQKLLQMVKQPPGVSQSASTHKFEHPLMKIKYLIDIDRYNVYGDGKL